MFHKKTKKKTYYLGKEPKITVVGPQGPDVIFGFAPTNATTKIVKQNGDTILFVDYIPQEAY